MAHLDLIKSVAEYQKFKKLYDDAVKKQLTEFDWFGAPVLVGYAKYVLEYYKPRFGKIK